MGFLDFLSATPTQSEMAINRADTQKRRDMHAAAQAYSNYRPEVMQARNNAMKNRMSAYQGANNALGAMYGGQGVTPQTGLPFSPNATGIGSIQGDNHNLGADGLGQFGFAGMGDPSQIQQAGHAPQPGQPGQGPQLDFGRMTGGAGVQQPTNAAPPPQRQFKFGRR
jgi:hypothetical protein